MSNKDNKEFADKVADLYTEFDGKVRKWFRNQPGVLGDDWSFDHEILVTTQFWDGRKSYYFLKETIVPPIIQEEFINRLKELF